MEAFLSWVITLLNESSRISLSTGDDVQFVFLNFAQSCVVSPGNLDGYDPRP